MGGKRCRGRKSKSDQQDEANKQRQRRLRKESDTLRNDLAKVKSWCDRVDEMPTYIMAAVGVLYSCWLATKICPTTEEKSFHLAATLSVVLKFAEDDGEEFTKLIRRSLVTNDGTSLRMWASAEWSVFSCASVGLWSQLQQESDEWWGAKAKMVSHLCVE